MCEPWQDDRTCLTLCSAEDLHARAMQMMVRHDAYNALLSQFEPGHIRLSIHNTANKDKCVSCLSSLSQRISSADQSSKYCINLLDNGCHCQETTPWHGVLVDHGMSFKKEADGSMSDNRAPRQPGLEIITKAKAEEKGYHLVKAGPNGCFYTSE